MPAIKRRALSDALMSMRDYYTNKTSGADVFRFTPGSGHRERRLGCPFSAKGRHRIVSSERVCKYAWRAPLRNEEDPVPEIKTEFMFTLALEVQGFTIGDTPHGRPKRIIPACPAGRM